MVGFNGIMVLPTIPFSAGVEGCIGGTAAKQERAARDGAGQVRASRQGRAGQARAGQDRDIRPGVRSIGF